MNGNAFLFLLAHDAALLFQRECHPVGCLFQIARSG
jgi:hypothetical protein